MELNEKERIKKTEQRSTQRGQSLQAARAPTATSPWQRVAPASVLEESGSDGGDLCALRLAHYVGNEVKQPGGAFVLRGLPLSCQASVYL